MGPTPAKPKALTSAPCSAGVLCVASRVPVSIAKNGLATSGGAATAPRPNAKARHSPERSCRTMLHILTDNPNWRRFACFIVPFLEPLPRRAATQRCTA